MPVVLGYPKVDDYRNDPYAMGSTVGRYANRIANGRFDLDGGTFQLATDPDTGHCLHGGAQGFHRRLWQTQNQSESDVTFALHSRHGDEGFPGNLDVQTRYALSAPGELTIEFSARTDRATVISMTNHAYFNLHGAATTVDDHVLQLNASRYTPVNDALIPTGTLATVEGTPLDFRSPRSLRSDDRLDTNFALDHVDGDLQVAATLFGPKSGLRLTVLTTQPGLQVYTADSLGTPFAPRAGICLEAQNFPDAPNHPQFPNAVLNPDSEYRETIVYRFDEVTP